MNITAKVIPVLILNLLLSVAVHAQKSGLIYYLKNSGKPVLTKDSSDYSMLVMPPDTSVDKNLYMVYEYDKNGKVRLVTNSYTSDINLKFQGRFIAYFPDGKKKRIGSYIGGENTGMEVDYYPNGKLYSTKTIRSNGKIFYNGCRDSTGAVLAENGNGEWVQFDEDFKYVIARGKINNGEQVGVWHLRKTASESFDIGYGKGRPHTPIDSNKSPNVTYAPVELVPEFPGGISAFIKFLHRNVKYPATAKANGTEGKVIVSFVVERDGSLTELTIKRGIGDGCDEEALRVMKLSPLWKPGIQAGHTVRVAYSLPISFPLN